MLSRQINEFLYELGRKSSPLTVRNYRHYLNRLLIFSNEVKTDELSLELIRGYTQFLFKWIDPKTKRLLKVPTRNYHLIALRAFLKYLAVRNHTSIDWRAVKLEQQRYKSPMLLPFSLVDRLLKAPDEATKSGVRDRAILELIFGTGLLVSQVVVLNRSDFSKRDRMLLVGGDAIARSRKVTIPERAAYWAERYLQSRQDTFIPLFIRYQGMLDLSENGEYMRLTARSIERIVTKYAKSAGISKQATPHSLRHALAGYLFEQGATTDEVKKTLNHAYSVTTKTLYQDFLR